jgi:hypothetical protein
MNEFAISHVSGSSELGALIAQTAKFLVAAKSKSTRLAYASDWADFERFTDRHGFPFLPSTPG